MNKKSRPSLGPQTRAIHAGEPNRRGVNGPVVTEIIRSSTFTFSSTEEMKLWAEGKNKAYIYTRYGNPTLSVAEKKIAALEGAEAAVVTSSGMAAISSALLAALKAGDEVISTAQTYGGTYRLMRDVFPNMGITVRQVGTDLTSIENLVAPRSKVLYVETPTNPTLRLVDIRKAVAFAKKHKLVSIIDNTFATPVLQNPITLGYDMVVHSATKALAGHSDIIAGVAVSRFEVPRRSQARRETNARIREHAGVRLEGRAPCGAALLRPRAAVPAGGEPRRSGVAGDSSDLQFALQHDGGRIAPRGRQSRNGARFNWFGRQRGFN